MFILQTDLVFLLQLVDFCHTAATLHDVTIGYLKLKACLFIGQTYFLIFDF